eukprot:6071170-Amphidinium_carterae.2
MTCNDGVSFSGIVLLPLEVPMVNSKQCIQVTVLYTRAFGHKGPASLVLRALRAGSHVECLHKSEQSA